LKDFNYKPFLENPQSTLYDLAVRIEKNQIDDVENQYIVFVDAANKIKHTWKHVTRNPKYVMYRRRMLIHFDKDVGSKQTSKMDSIHSYIDDREKLLDELRKELITKETPSQCTIS
jgi:hypothetical protein